MNNCFQVTKTLPKSAWQNVVIKENDEPLVEVLETDRIKIVNMFGSNYNPIYFVRKTIAEKLIEVSCELPDNINLVLIEGYRTLKNQEDSWNKLFDKIKLSQDIKYLSMGMSDSYHIAVQEGANLVRIGTAIFGPRT